VLGFSETFNQPFVFCNKLTEYLVEISAHVVIVDDVDEIHSIVASMEEGIRFRLVSVNEGPGVQPHLEGLIFPDLEGVVVNHRRLNDFLTLEDTPGHSIHVILGHVQPLVSLLIDGLIGDHWVLVQESDQRLNQLLGDEEFVV
jgi:hypothetical protein